MVAAFYYGFWAFIYQYAWWNKPLLIGLMASGINWVLSPVCFLMWILFETWAKHPELIPSFKLEKKEKTTTEKEETEDKGERLPL